MKAKLTKCPFCGQLPFPIGRQGKDGSYVYLYRHPDIGCLLDDLTFMEGPWERRVDLPKEPTKWKITIKKKEVSIE